MRRLRVALVAAVLSAACNRRVATDHVPEGKSGDCARCHMPEFERTRSHPGKKPTTCGTCHGETRYRPLVKVHAWTLDGAHEKTPCFSCHTGTTPKYEGLPGECVDCHRDDYKKARRHENKPETCADCHLTSSWKETKKKRGGARD